jgi:EpsD family peptidyl-prolyl cis-trans isomerase
MEPHHRSYEFLSEFWHMTTINKAILASAALGMLTLAACDKGNKAPEGQVVATVDGQEVTIHELNAEIAGIGNRASGAPAKLVESVALQRVIERKMLATEASKLKLDKNPQFLLAKQRTEDNLLVQALQADIQQKVPPATREAAQKYVSDNPQVFGDRKLFTLDQIQFLRPANIDQLPLKNAKTMAEVERVLIDANIEYRRAPQQLDSLVINPELTKEIVKISASANGEPFIFSDQPAGAPAPIIYVNNITNTVTQPFTGERAIAYAQNILQRQDVQKRLASELKRIQDSYKPKIVYGKGYEAPDPKKFQAAAAAAAAAAAKASAPTVRPTGTTAAPAAAAPASAAAPTVAAEQPAAAGLTN